MADNLDFERDTLEERLKSLDGPLDDGLEALDEVLRELSQLSSEEPRNQVWLVLHKRALVLAADIRIAGQASRKPHEEALDVVYKKIRKERLGIEE